MELRRPVGSGTAGQVPRLGRVLDLAGAVLFLAGASLYAWAWTGFRGVQSYQPSIEEGAWAAVQVANGYWRLQRIGAALIVLGIGVFVSAWWVAGRKRKAATDGA